MKPAPTYRLDVTVRFGLWIHKICQSSRYQRLVSEYQTLVSEYQTLIDEYSRLVSEYQALVSEYQRLVSEHQRLVGDYQRLVGEYQRLMGEYQRLIDEYQRFIDEYQRLVGESFLLSCNLLFAARAKKPMAWHWKQRNRNQAEQHKGIEAIAPAVYVECEASFA